MFLLFPRQWESMGNKTWRGIGFALNLKLSSVIELLAARSLWMTFFDQVAHSTGNLSSYVN